MQSKLKLNLQRYFSSRNGIDELGLLFFILSIIFGVLFAFFTSFYQFLSLSIISLGYCLFRIFSKNILARERENTAFCNFFVRKPRVKKQKVNKEKKVKVKKQKVKKEKVKKEKKQDKDYLYLNCSSCNYPLKVSRKIKGVRHIMCTHCGNEVEVKVK